MQTTLLGLAIALILALLAALVGPYVIDWNQFRSQFEAEASRVVGLPVRVAGPLDARLLPTPSLTLRRVVVGPANGPQDRIGAERLDVTFSLGSLMRGEWRAEEMTVSGLSLNVGLDDRGRLDWPASSPGFDLASLTIDRLNLAGRLALRDAVSGRVLNIEDITFSGDVRGGSLAIRGDGRFRFDGVPHPFRLSTSRTSDGAGQRVRFSVENADSVTTEVEGALTSNAGVPRFDGTLTAGRSVALRASGAQSGIARPWQITGKLTADPAKARLEQVELSYGGGEEPAVKLSGAADMTFGAQAGMVVALSARQIDADRLMVQNDVNATPAQLLPGLRTLLPSIPAPPLPAQLDVSLETVTLGQRAVQGVTLAMRGDERGWIINRLAFRPPGATRTAINGRIDGHGPQAEFTGAFDIEANDPELLLAWVQGRSVSGIRSQKRLQAKGQVAIGAERIGIENLSADLDGALLKGGFSVAIGAGDQRFKADIVADRFDLDAASAFAKNLSQFEMAWPADNEVNLDLAQTTVLGQEAKQLKARIVSDDKRFNLEKFSIAEVNGLALDGSASLDRAALTGRVRLNASSASFERAADFVAPLFPGMAERMRVTPGAGPARFALALDAGGGSGSTRNLRASLDIDSVPIKGKLTAQGDADLAGKADLEALQQAKLTLGADLASPDVRNFLAMLKLDRIVAGEGAAQLAASATGNWRSAFQVNAKLTARDVAADLKGAVDVQGDRPKGTLALNLERANVAPLLGAASAAIPVALTGNLTLADGKIASTDLAGTWAGSRFRGKATVTPGDVVDISGEVGLDQVDLPSVLSVALGYTGRGGDEALTRGPIGGWRGRIAFQALGASLPDGGSLRGFGGVVTADGTSLNLSGLSGALGGGKVSGDLQLKRANDVVTLDSSLQLAAVDGAVLRDRALAMPAGKVSGQISLSGNGRSINALAGSLSGSGSLKLDGLTIARLDPAAFEAAVRASDQGLAVDPQRITPVVDRALAAGPLRVASAEVPFTIRNGRLRIDSSVLDAQGAQMTLSGGYDIPAAQLDLRALLASTTVAGSADAGRPALQVILRGSTAGLTRTLDVTTLSSWLALRTIDRETKRLEMLERTRLPPAAPAVPPPSAPSLVPSTPQPVPDATAPNAAVPDGAETDDKSRQPNAIVSPDDASQPGSALSELPPLPPPVTVRPAPGSFINAPPRPKAAPRPPMVLTPPIAR